MNVVVNEEIANLNIDILAKAGIKKSIINKLHKLKAKKIADMSKIEMAQLEELFSEDSAINMEQVLNILNNDLLEFTRRVFNTIKTDPTYEIVMLHIENHTHQEIAKRYAISKEKVKQNINKFLQNLFTLVDAMGDKLIANKPYIGIEELENMFVDEEDYKLLALAFKAHDTKWVYHTEAECFTKK